MTYPLNPELMYMMPTHFGPMCGPRQGPGGKKFAFEQDQRKCMAVSVSFLTNAAQLQEFLPPGFELMGEPVVTVFETYMKEIDWLAGRGYNVLGVNFPVVYQGQKDRAVGLFPCNPSLMRVPRSAFVPSFVARNGLGSILPTVTAAP